VRLRTVKRIAKKAGIESRSAINSLYSRMYETPDSVRDPANPQHKRLLACIEDAKEADTIARLDVPRLF
jgi:hypothetical protein